MLYAVCKWHHSQFSQRYLPSFVFSFEFRNQNWYTSGSIQCLKLTEIWQMRKAPFSRYPRRLVVSLSLETAVPVGPATPPAPASRVRLPPPRGVPSGHRIRTCKEKRFGVEKHSGPSNPGFPGSEILQIQGSGLAGCWHQPRPPSRVPKAHNGLEARSRCRVPLKK